MLCLKYSSESKFVATEYLQIFRTGAIKASLSTRSQTLIETVPHLTSLKKMMTSDIRRSRHFWDEYPSCWQNILKTQSLMSVLEDV